ncbi:hypothetical protein LEP1GSC029_4229 [Leptospira interrogans str. 2002000626]|uniref:Uncharacterized protein n=1 Tax=Leptospira interrogans str. 2002000626 TaxID=996803 RepID=A0A829D035_LEPIR|nr:hypothetical protein LEP1GSC029_4229 [Leptospira interrogans str. 2002000626]
MYLHQMSLRRSNLYRFLRLFFKKFLKDSILRKSSQVKNDFLQK